jgi:hypothetical protein
MSAALALLKLFFGVPQVLGMDGWVLDCTGLGTYMEVPRILSFISGLERPVLWSIDIAHFAPQPAKEQYPQGEQQMHFP